MHTDAASRSRPLDARVRDRLSPASTEAAGVRALADERLRLETVAGIADRHAHFRRPEERPFTAEERGRVTILIGGLTPTHEALIKAVLEA